MCCNTRRQMQGEARAEQAEAELERLRAGIRELAEFAWQWPGAEPIVDQMVELGLLEKPDA